MSTKNRCYYCNKEIMITKTFESEPCCDECFEDFKPVAKCKDCGVDIAQCQSKNKMNGNCPYCWRKCDDCENVRKAIDEFMELKPTPAQQQTVKKICASYACSDSLLFDMWKVAEQRRFLKRK